MQETPPPSTGDGLLDWILWAVVAVGAIFMSVIAALAKHIENQNRTAITDLKAIVAATEVRATKCESDREELHGTCAVLQERITELERKFK